MELSAWFTCLSLVLGAPDAGEAPPAILVASEEGNLLQLVSHQEAGMRHRVAGKPTALVSTSFGPAYVACSGGVGHASQLAVLNVPSGALITVLEAPSPEGTPSGEITALAPHPNGVDAVCAVEPSGSLWRVTPEGQAEPLTDVRVPGATGIVHTRGAWLIAAPSRGEVVWIEEAPSKAAFRFMLEVGADSLVADPKGGRAWALNPANDTVFLLDLVQQNAHKRAAVLQGSRGLAYDVTRDQLLITSETRGSLARYDAGSLRPLDTIQLVRGGAAPGAALAGPLELTQDGRRACVLSPGRGEVLVVDLEGSLVLTRHEVLARPVGLALLADRQLPGPLAHLGD